MLKTRLRNVYRFILSISVTLLVFSFHSVTAWAEPHTPNPSELAEAVEEIEKALQDAVNLE